MRKKSKYSVIFRLMSGHRIIGLGSYLVVSVTATRPGLPISVFIFALARIVIEILPIFCKKWLLWLNFVVLATGDLNF